MHLTPAQAPAAQSSPEQKQTQSYLVRANFIGSLSKDMLMGGYFVAFAVQVLAFSNAQISWFLSVIPLIVLLRYPFLDVIRRYPRVYPTRAGRAIGLFCVAVLAVLPTDWFTIPVLLGLAALFVFGNEFLQNAVWTNFVTEVTTPHDRGKFLGRLRTWKILTAMGFAVFGFFLVGETLSRGEHRILSLVVMLLLVNSLFWYWKTPARAPPEPARGFSGKGRFFAIIRSSGLFRRPLALEFVEKVLASPILTVYLIGTLNLPANLFMLTLMAGMLGPICSVFLWGRRADNDGVKSLYVTYFTASILLYPVLFLIPDFSAVPPLGLQFTAGLAALLMFEFLRGVLSAGQGMAKTLLLAQFAKDRDGFHAVNILSAMSQLMSAGLTALGGLLLLRLHDIRIADYEFGAAGVLWFDPFRVILIGAVCLLCLAGVAISRGLPSGD